MSATLVKDVMTREVTTLLRNEKLTLAADIMNLGRIRHLPVLDDDWQEVIGIVSQRDLFRGALARALGYGEHARRKMTDTLSVKDVMTTDVSDDHTRHPAQGRRSPLNGAQNRLSSCAQGPPPGWHPHRGRLRRLVCAQSRLAKRCRFWLTKGASHLLQSSMKTQQLSVAEAIASLKSCPM